MIDEGVLDDPNVDAAFALHVAPNLPSGSIWTQGGALMASADVLDITVTGKGGHASTPYLANDPMPVAAEIVQALQMIVTRRIDTFDPVVDHDHEDPRRHDDQRDPRDRAHAGHAARGVASAVAGSALEGIERVVAGHRRAAHEHAADVARRARLPADGQRRRRSPASRSRSRPSCSARRTPAACRRR